jgi:hypothetical protein
VESSELSVLLTHGHVYRHAYSCIARPCSIHIYNVLYCTAPPHAVFQCPSACFCHRTRSQAEADSNWNVPQLLWQTVAPDRCRGYVQIVEAPLAGRLWEATPDPMKWRLHPKLIRELEEPPPEEDEPPEPSPQPMWSPDVTEETGGWSYSQWGTSQGTWQDRPSRWHGTSSSSTSAWSPSDAAAGPVYWGAWSEGAWTWRTH